MAHETGLCVCVCFPSIVDVYTNSSCFYSCPPRPPALFFCFGFGVWLFLAGEKGEYFSPCDTVHVH